MEYTLFSVCFYHSPSGDKIICFLIQYLSSVTQKWSYRVKIMEFGSYFLFMFFSELLPCISEMAHVSFKCFQIEAMPKWRLGYPLHGYIDEVVAHLYSLRSSELPNLYLRKLSILLFPKREGSHLLSRSPPMWWQQYQCN